MVIIYLTGFVLTGLFFLWVLISNESWGWWTVALSASLLWFVAVPYLIIGEIVHFFRRPR